MEVGSRTEHPLEWLLDHFAMLPKRGATLLVGVDGRGGSGKTTLCGALSAHTPSVVDFVSLNSFYIPVEQQTTSPPDQRTSVDDTDLPRLFRQVIDPLKAGKRARYQRWDMITNVLAEWREVEPGGVVLLEGVGAASMVLRPYLDCTMWLACPREIRVKRGLQRDGEAMRGTWETQWLPAGDRYEQIHRPMDYADLVIDSSGLKSHDPQATFVLVRLGPS